MKRTAILTKIRNNIKAIPSLNTRAKIYSTEKMTPLRIQLRIVFFY